MVLDEANVAIEGGARARRITAAAENVSAATLLTSANSINNISLQVELRDRFFNLGDEGRR